MLGATPLRLAAGDERSRRASIRMRLRLYGLAAGILVGAGCSYLWSALANRQPRLQHTPQLRVPHPPTHQVTELLAGMTPDAVRLDLCTRGYDAARQSVLGGLAGAKEGREPWFDFHYVEAPLPAELRQRWVEAGQGRGPRHLLGYRHSWLACQAW